MLVKQDATFFVEGDALGSQHVALLIRAAEREACGHAAVLEHHAMAGNAARVGAGLGVRMERVAHVTGGAGRTDEASHLPIGGHFAPRHLAYDVKYAVGKIAHGSSCLSISDTLRVTIAEARERNEEAVMKSKEPKRPTAPDGGGGARLPLESSGGSLEAGVSGDSSAPAANGRRIGNAGGADVPAPAASGVHAGGAGAAARVVHTIEPVFDERSRVLVLGTMPSPKSREIGFYYGHPQNRFWRVLAALFEESVPTTNEERTALLLNHRIALWDVLASCTIKGASDASIADAVPNDLSRITEAAPIECVFCTGATAARLYRKHCEAAVGIPAVQLPSTSPANAAWSLDRLIEAYRPVAEAVTPPVAEAVGAEAEVVAPPVAKAVEMPEAGV